MSMLFSIPLMDNVVSAGWYLAVISQMVVNTTDYGSYLKTTFKILDDGPFKNWSVPVFFTIADSSNKVREEIGLRTYSNFVRACGLSESPGDTDDFEGLQVKILVDTYVDKDGKTRNCVKAYARAEASEASDAEEPKTGEIPF